MLQLAKDLALPLSAPAVKLAWIGTGGSGKTYGAMRLAELMWHAKMQFVALDTMGIWYGMRIDKNRKKPGLPITVIGGQHGDLPVRPQDGALVAEIIVRERISAIIDISEFEHETDKARFAKDFANRIYHLKKTNPSAIHVFLEEAHEFIPQDPQKSDNLMLHAWTRLWKQGRNYGIGGSIITQRPQDVAKKALGLSVAVFAFNITGAPEYDAMLKWMKRVEGIETLPELQPGHCLLWSPSWLSQTRTIHISQKETFHVAFDPNAPVEKDPVDQRVLAKVEIKALREQMKEAAEEAEANDPELLKKKIAALEKELTTLRSQPAADPAEIERQVTLRLEQKDIQFRGYVTRAQELLDRSTAEVRQHYEMMGKHAADLLKIITPPPIILDGLKFAEAGTILESLGGKSNGETRIHVIEKSSGTAVPPAPVITPREIDMSGPLSPSAQKFINGLGELMLTMDPVEKDLLGYYIGVPTKKSTFRGIAGPLKRDGYVEEPSNGTIRLTDAGRQLAVVDAPRSRAEMHAFWRGKLSAKAALMFDALIRVYPNGLSNEALAIAGQTDRTLSTYRGLRGELKNMGLVEYVGDDVVARSILFPEGVS
jgi:uncharacterized protein